MGKIIPETRSGQISFLLLSASVLLFVFVQIIVMSGQRGGDTFLDNLWISIPMLLAFICVIGSAIAGIISIVKEKEYTILVIFACLLGLIVLFFVIGEFLFPH